MAREKTTDRRAEEIKQHTEYAKQRISAQIAQLSEAELLSGKATLQLMHTASYPVTDDCWKDTSYVPSLGTVYRVPDHFVHAETREALCAWLRAEGFRAVTVNRHSDSFERGVGTQALVCFEWDV